MLLLSLGASSVQNVSVKGHFQTTFARNTNNYIRYDFFRDLYIVFINFFENLKKFHHMIKFGQKELIPCKHVYVSAFP